MANVDPSLVFKPDKYGRHSDSLALTGGTLNVSVSGTSNGDYIPGSRLENLTRPTMLRISATLDVRVKFSADGASAATSGDILFLAGTEGMPLPTGCNYVNVIANDGVSTGSFSVTVAQ